MAQKLGDQLYKAGYKGAFCMDFLIDTDTRKVYLGEINPRISGASPMTNLITSTYGGCPVYMFHLLEFMGVDWELDLSSVQQRWAEFDNWSQLILKYPVDKVEMITKAPASGIWRMNDKGDISLVRKSIDWFLVSGEDEAFYLRVYTAGDYRYHGADMGILVSRGRFQTDDRKLTDRAKALGRGHSPAVRGDPRVGIFCAGASAHERQQQDVLIMPKLADHLTLETCLPQSGLLVGRVWNPGEDGPSVVRVDGDRVLDITASFPTMRDLCETDDPAGSARAAEGEILGGLAAILANTAPETRNAAQPWLLPPIDLQCVKAAGVTFATSMLERVIEERARGNPEAAADIRTSIGELIGDDLSKLKPGSPQAMKLKQVLIEKGVWSQYLEVGIGPDAEIFTKSQVLSSVGHGMEAGLNAISTWNNPEPEVVVVVASSGRIVGATLGNDVNLRDVEGRSGLLLGKAKDNNASCAIGPFIRLFDGDFTIDSVRHMQLTLTVEGEDGYVLKGGSNMSPHQPRSGRSRRPDAECQPPVSRWCGPLSRHALRARRGPRRSGQGLHPQAGRHRHRGSPGAWRTDQSHGACARGTAMDLRAGPAHAQSGAARIDLTTIRRAVVARMGNVVGCRRKPACAFFWQSKAGPRIMCQTG